MRKRNVAILFRLNKKEAEALDKKVKRSGLNREAYLRQLISGVVPRDAPPPDYYSMMRELHKIGNNLNQIAQKAHVLNVVDTVLPDEIIKAVEDCGFFESIPLWAVTLIGGLFITVLSFIMIMSVYGRFFRLYLYTAIAPIPLSSFAGEPSQNIGRSFLKSYAAVCLEGAIVVLACIIFSLFASSPPVVDPDAAAVIMVWSYIGELIFNMLVLVGAVKMSDRVVREMMGL